MKRDERVAKGSLPYAESSWHAGEKVRQINGVSAITYSKIHRDDKKERKRKKVPNNGGARVKNEENQGTAQWIRT